MKKATAVIFAAAVAAITTSSEAAWSAAMGSKSTRSGSFAKSLSSITWAGGTTYYGVGDDADAGEGRIYRFTGNVTGGTAISISGISSVALEKVYDVEGCAYDHGNGTIWIANEVESATYGAGRNEISEYNVTTGKRTGRQAVLPSWFNSATVGNYGLESLSIAPDGLTLWTANEEALTCDDTRSSYSKGTVCRLVKFTRATIYDDWELTAMYAYRTEKWSQQYGYGGTGRRGISDLEALPDGSLLIMERECSTDSDGTDFWAKLGLALYYGLYVVTPEQMAAAGNILDNHSLKTTSGWNVVGKSAIVSNNYSDSLCNYEGLCCGMIVPNTGNSSILLCSDAGDGNSTAALKPGYLGGYAVRDLKINQPSEGLSSPANLARYTNGTQVVVQLLDIGTEPTAYTNDGARVATTCSYQSVITTNTAAIRTSNSGATARWRIWYDETLTWTVNTVELTSDIKDHDSFETYAAGTTPGSMAGWSGEGEVVTLAYVPPTPPGYPLTREDHTKVFSADNATRTVAGTTTAATKFDMMVQVLKPTVALTTEESGSSVFTVSVDRDGRFYLFARDADWNAKWIRLSDKVYSNGEWVRVEADIKYIQGGSLVGYVAVKLNGSICPTEDGYLEAGGNVQGGAWHRLNGSRAVASFQALGTKLDDYVYAKDAFAVEASGTQQTEDGIDFAWLDRQELPRDSEEAKTWLTERNRMCGYGTVSDLFKSGVNPEDNEPLQVTHIELGEDGKVYLEFNGYKGEQPENGYRVIRATKLDFSDGVPLRRSEGSFEADIENWETSWEGDTTERTKAFYRIEAVPTEN